jgi:hypothetical protein
VLHLIDTDLAGIDDATGLAGSIDGAAEVKAGNLVQVFGQQSSGR